MFYLELMWNREFHWTRRGQPRSTLQEAITFAKEIENMGDGARVKKTRILDEHGNVRWQYGQIVHQMYGPESKWEKIDHGMDPRHRR